jgi:hypothetical protein
MTETVTKLPAHGVHLVASTTDGNLHVVSQSVMLNTVMVENSVGVFCIVDELERTLSRALWHTTVNRSRNSLMTSAEEVLCPFGKARLKPVESCISDRESLIEYRVKTK